MSIAFTENCITKMIVDFKFEKRRKNEFYIQKNEFFTNFPVKREEGAGATDEREDHLRNRDLPGDLGIGIYRAS